MKPGLPSPCINVCRMDPATGWCAGCLRTLDEIARWSTLPDPMRQTVWTQLPLRQAVWLQRGGAAPPPSVPQPPST